MKQQCEHCDLYIAKGSGGEVYFHIQIDETYEEYQTQLKRHKISGREPEPRKPRGKCKHCDTPIVSFPFPQTPGQTKTDKVYWAHDYGSGVFAIHSLSPFLGHAAEPHELEIPPLPEPKTLCKHCDVPLIRKYMPLWPGETEEQRGFYWHHDYGNGVHSGYAYSPHFHSAEPLTPTIPKVPDNRLWIFMHQTGAWECHKSTNREMRDYLRQVWRSAGHPTAVCK